MRFLKAFLEVLIFSPVAIIGVMIVVLETLIKLIRYAFR